MSGQDAKAMWRWTRLLVGFASVLFVSFAVSGERLGARSKTTQGGVPSTSGFALDQVSAKLKEIMAAAKTEGLAMTRDTGSVQAGWLKADSDKWVSFTKIRLEKGKSYRLIAVGDDNAADVDLALCDAKGKQLAEEASILANSIVNFEPLNTQEYNVKLMLYRSHKNRPCLCMVVVLEKQVNAKGIGQQGPIIRQGFPANTSLPNDLSKSQTGWEIEWGLTPKGGVLTIKSAKFMWKDKQRQARWLTVARNIELAEAFAAYDDMKTSFLDVAEVGPRTLKADIKNLGPSCVAPGKILDAANPKFKNAVYMEVHDDGLRWIKGNGPPNPAYRGERLMLWSVFQAVNYCYIVEYDFTDDGRIVCRLGFTGHNFFNRGKGGGGTTEGDVHLHVGCWRFDFDLSDPKAGTGGPKSNDILLVKRYFDRTNRRFRVAQLPFPGNFGKKGQQAHEGKAKWVPEEFTTLRAVSRVVNGGGMRKVAYDLIPSRMGSVRNLLPTGLGKAGAMDFVNYDFWVTKAEEKFRKGHYHKVAKFAKEKRPLAGQPTTVWYSAPAIHVPRGEDFGPDGTSRGKGVALTTWIEFTLRPRNVFDRTPFYPQKPSP